jgi:hypothetical protein
MRSKRNGQLNAIIKYFNARDMFDIRSKHKMKFLNEYIIDDKVASIRSRGAMKRRQQR